MEKTLALTISEIRNRLPGIDLYRHIYDENHALDHTLQNQIVAAYQTFIDFCIVATKYYKARGARKCALQYVTLRNGWLISFRTLAEGIGPTGQSR